VKIWDSGTWGCLITIPVPKKVTELCINDGYLFLSDRSGAVYQCLIEDLKSGSELKLVLGHCSWITTMIVNSASIVTGDRDKKIRISSYPDVYNIISYCLGHSTFLSKVAYVPGAKNMILSGGGDGLLYLWDISNGSNIHKLSLGSSESIIRCIVAIDSELFVILLEGQSRLEFVQLRENTVGVINMFSIAALNVNSEMILSVTVSFSQIWICTIEGVCTHNFEKIVVDSTISLKFSERRNIHNIEQFKTLYFDTPPSPQSKEFTTIKEQLSMSILKKGYIETNDDEVSIPTETKKKKLRNTNK